MAAFWRAEGGRWGLWSAPFFAGGVGWYFFLPNEPPLWVGVGLLAGISVLLLAALWRHSRWSVPLTLVLMAVCGFVAATVRTALVAAPVLVKPLGPINISGTVLSIEAHQDQWRVVLGSLVIERLETAKTPIRVRLTVRDIGQAHPGSMVGLLAKLMPPPEPQLPAGYDFARQAWFSQLGAVGFAYGPLEVFQPLDPDLSPGGDGKLDQAWRRFSASAGQWVRSARLEVEAARGRLFVLVQDAVGPEHAASGGVAAALLTGMRGAIPPATGEAYRESGLAHLLAISGLHMGLAGGLFFFLLRAVIALCPPLAVRVNGKKIAAVGALLGMTCYLLVSGSGVPAQRAYIMGVFLFGAILFDRSAISLRILTVAAIAVLLLYPEALIGPSFQMSFAAVTALIALYEQMSGPLSRWRRGAGETASPHRLLYRSRGLGFYILGIALTTLIAGLATMPYGAFHFHKASLFGLASNLVAVPLVSTLVMPLLMATVVLAPFGAQGIIGPYLGWVLDLIETIALSVSSWPYASVSVPPVPTGVLTLFTVSALWVLLWRQAWRWAGVPVLALCCLVPWMQAPPDILINQDGDLLAVRQEDGLALSPGRGDGYVRTMWAEWWGRSTYNGSKRGTLWSAPGVSCDPLACRIVVRGQNISWALHPAALVEDCGRVQAILSPLTLARAACGDRDTLLIDRRILARSGARMIWVDWRGRLQMLTVADYRGNRPWSRLRPEGGVSKYTAAERGQSIVRKSGYRFCAKTMRLLKTLERFCVSE